MAMAEPFPRAAGQPEVGWYLYAFLCHWHLPSMTGIDGHSPLTLMAEEGTYALASLVPLAEFGEEALRRNLEDLHWLEEKVRLHETIVEAALAKGPILPMKFCTIFLEPERILTVIRRHAPALQQAFDHLGGKEEWGVKGLSNRTALRAALLQNDPTLLALSREASAKPPGQAFFLKKKIEVMGSTIALEREEEMARQAVGAIREKVVELVEHPPCLPCTTGEEELALNLACLVEQAAVEAFLWEVRRWNRDHAQAGFRLLTSGPWPPYHFTPRFDHDE